MPSLLAPPPPHLPHGSHLRGSHLDPPSTAQQIPVTLASVYHWAGGFSSVIPSSVSLSVVKCLLRARNFSGWWRYQGGWGGAPALRQIAPSSWGEVGWGKFSSGDTEDPGGAPGPALLFTEVQLHCRHTEVALRWAILRRLLPPCPSATSPHPPPPRPHTHTDSKMLSKRSGRLLEEHRARHLSWMWFPKLAALYATLVGRSGWEMNTGGRPGTGWGK